MAGVTVSLFDVGNKHASGPWFTYMNLRRATKQEGKSGNDTIELLKRLLVEMRRDVGRSDLNFNKVILSICCWIAILFV